MDKIAIISDIHGNLEALKKVLQDINKRNISKIFCLGDIIAKGIHSKECIELVRKNCEIVIQGNCERFFTKDYNLEDLNKLNEINIKRIKWNKNMISGDDSVYLNNLPFCYEFYMSGSLIRLFHASPLKDDDVVISLDSIEKKLSLFKPSEKTISKNMADIVIYGHIHHQYMDKLYNKTVINVGSVGNSYDTIRNDNKDSNILETINAHYLIIEGNFNEKDYGNSISFQFIRVPYDVQKELLELNLNLEPENYKYELEQGKYRDQKILNSKFISLGIDVNKL